MKVRATSKYKEKGLKDKELGRIPKEGEEFDVSAERFEILNGYNKYNEVFVTKVEEETSEEIPEEETQETENVSTEATQNVENDTKKNPKKKNSKSK